MRRMRGGRNVYTLLLPEDYVVLTEDTGDVNYTTRKLIEELNTLLWDL